MPSNSRIPKKVSFLQVFQLKFCAPFWSTWRVLHVSSSITDAAVITSVTSAEKLKSHLPRRKTNSDLNVTERRADKSLVVRSQAAYEKCLMCKMRWDMGGRGSHVTVALSQGQETKTVLKVPGHCPSSLWETSVKARQSIRKCRL